MSQQKVQFKKAVKRQVKLKIAASGTAGSGKTESLLRVVTGFLKDLPPRADKFQPDPFDPSKQIPLSRIAFLDAENGSASLYSDRFDFDVIELEPPFTTNKYNDAINAAVADGYDWLIIDSITHAWAGEGGLLDKKDTMDSADRKKQFNNWKPIGNEQNVFINTILFSDIHIACTMRSKSAYVLEKNSAGKEQPKKVGMAPIQRDGVEYEFTLMLEMENGGFATCSKDRTPLFMNRGEFKVDYADGVKLREWLERGAPMTDQDKAKMNAKIEEAKAAANPKPPQTQGQNQQNRQQQQAQQTNQQKIEQYCRTLGFDMLEMKSMVIECFHTPQDFNKLDVTKCTEFCNFVKAVKKRNDDEQAAAKKAKDEADAASKLKTETAPETGSVPDFGG